MNSGIEAKKKMGLNTLSQLREHYWVRYQTFPEEGPVAPSPCSNTWLRVKDRYAKDREQEPKE